MSNFDLPPLLGFDRFQRQLPQLAPQDPVRLRPEGARAADAAPSPDEQAPSSAAFEGFLADSIGKVQQLQADVREKARGLALGEDVEVHDYLMAAGKSEVAFNLMLEVRNKLVDAWEKLSRSAV